MARITLGINNCFACKRWPEPEEWARIVAQELGLTTVQLTFDLLDPRTHEPAMAAQVQRIREAAVKYSVSIHSTFTGLAAYSTNLLLHPHEEMRLDALKWYEAAVRLTERIGAGATGGHFGALSVADWQHVQRPVQLAGQFKESLQHLAGLAQRSGQAYMLWEPMPVARERPSTIDEALRLHDWINEGSPLPIWYCLDMGHSCAYGNAGQDLDPYQWVRRVGKLSPVIHLQQTDGRGDHHWPFTRQFNACGIIDARRMVDAINESGVEEVLLVLEVIHAFEADESSVLGDLRESVDYWRAALAV